MTNVMHDFFIVYLFILLTLYMFRAHRAHHQETQIVSIQLPVAVTLRRWPCRVQVGSFVLLFAVVYFVEQEFKMFCSGTEKVVLIQFVSPDDEHDVLETCRELKVQINT
jgi:hypothetical protein